ncbi:MAG: UDP-N-acetylglucosamine 2-epimerase (non-hydrolyzing) [Nanoarchaeota archaeon]|nr:UDP-N-acetylglucosamine 2-epimerase (non-hydrolyzing) [Nanoarchaeota archaeon]
MKIATILGTRPEIIKLSPLLPLLDKEFQHVIIHTGQHYDYEMDAIFLNQLHLRQPDYNLHIGSHSAGKQTGLMLEKLESTFLKEKPDCVVVQGDTNSVLAGSLAAAKLHIKVAHVEAGCRNFNRQTPEEINRIVADHLSEFLFPADENSRKNLLQEGFPNKRIYLVGNNTIYDACRRNIPFADKRVLETYSLLPGSFVLVTIHRAENTDEKKKLQEVVQALNDISSQIKIIFPIHPRTKKKLDEFGLILSHNIIVTEPLDYLRNLSLIQHSRFCITDSGGIQEEAVAFDVPCLIPLNETCWPRLVEAGKNFLTGQNSEGILAKARQLLDDTFLQLIKSIPSPYIPGASERIVAVLKAAFEMQSEGSKT